MSQDRPVNRLIEAGQDLAADPELLEAFLPADGDASRAQLAELVASDPDLARILGHGPGGQDSAL